MNTDKLFDRLLMAVNDLLYCLIDPERLKGMKRSDLV